MLAFFSLLMIISFSTPSLSAPVSKKEKAQGFDGVQEISIPMAKGELRAQVEAEQSQRERANAPKTLWELRASSWSPENLSSPSRIPGASSFQKKGIPQMEALILSPMGSGAVSFEIGLGILALERSGKLEGGGLAIPVDQNAYLGSLRIGGLYSPFRLWKERITPYFGACALPSLFLTRRSAFDDGNSQTGFALEGNMGALLQIQKSLHLDLGAARSFGRMGGADMGGFSLRAGLRVPI